MRFKLFDIKQLRKAFKELKDIELKDIYWGRFEKNPIMFWNHGHAIFEEEYRVPVGKWQGLEINEEEGCAYATAVVSENSAFSNWIKTQVEEGFIRACSIALGYNEDTKKYDIFEVSIVDVPRLEDSVIQDQKVEKEDKKEVYLKKHLKNVAFEKNNVLYCAFNSDDAIIKKQNVMEKDTKTNEIKADSKKDTIPDSQPVQASATQLLTSDAPVPGAPSEEVVAKLNADVQKAKALMHSLEEKNKQAEAREQKAKEKEEEEIKLSAKNLFKDYVEAGLCKESEDVPVWFLNGIRSDKANFVAQIEDQIKNVAKPFGDPSVIDRVKQANRNANSQNPNEAIFKVGEEKQNTQKVIGLLKEHFNNIRTMSDIGADMHLSEKLKATQIARYKMVEEENQRLEDAMHMGGYADDSCLENYLANAVAVSTDKNGNQHIINPTTKEIK